MRIPVSLLPRRHIQLSLHLHLLGTAPFGALLPHLYVLHWIFCWVDWRRNEVQAAAVAVVLGGAGVLVEEDGVLVELARANG